MNVRWTPEAEQDRQDIFDYLGVENQAAALTIDVDFDRLAEKLMAFPKLGRVGKLSNTREIRASTSYRMVYQVAEDTVWILAIVHTARRWPPFRE